MRLPVIVGIIGGLQSGKVSFSKLLQKHLADKHKLTSYVLNSKNNPELINVKKEHDLEEVFESAKADVVMVAGVTLLQNEKLRAQLDFRIFLESDADQRLAEFIKKAKKGPDDDVEAIMEQYFTQVKPSYEQTLQWKDHAHFFAEVNMPEEKMGLLGLMIKDMVQKHHELADLLHLH
uniref:Phosphoribulokinase/uridine kinase domain-containing protein n=2 Tax=Parascaris univalens TaxID=6257 RepID=A0A915C3K2_PARUN